eukprot:scaffold10915_cov85-Cyclotella_meneghiniana.AAC.2
MSCFLGRLKFNSRQAVVSWGRRLPVYNCPLVLTLPGLPACLHLQSQARNEATITHLSTVTV